MGNKQSAPPKKVGWLTDIVPIIKEKIKGRESDPKIIDFYNYNRIRHNRKILLDILQGKAKANNRLIPISLNPSEKQTFVSFLQDPSIANIDSIETLKDALQSAVEIEFATMPPYLTAAYTLNDQSSDMYKAIKGVAMEEMYHLGLAANMLRSIGGCPKFDTETITSTYPKALPYGLGKGKQVPIRKLTAGEGEDSQINIFMDIELPSILRTPEKDNNGVFTVDENSHSDSYSNTIGELYDEIYDAMENLDGVTFNQNDQVDLTKSYTDVPIFPILSLEDAQKAITDIKEEGEGAAEKSYGLDPTNHENTEPDPDNPKLAHYFAFSEISYQKRIKLNLNDQKEVEGFQYSGDDYTITDADVINMTDNPKLADLDPTNANQSDAFDASNAFAASYKGMIDNLNTAFGGSPGNIDNAIYSMYDVSSKAMATLKVLAPNENDVYWGPTWEMPVPT